MVSLKRVDVLKSAALAGVLNFFISLLFLLIIFFFVLIAFLASSPFEGSISFLPGIGIIFLIALVVPFIVGGLSFIGGLVITLLFNLALRLIGGVGMSFEED